MWERGFWATLGYWLERTEHLVREDWIPYRLTLIGDYGSDLSLRREINRYLANEDPYGTAAFVRWGLERGELRRDVDVELTTSILDWTMERFQDALVTGSCSRASSGAARVIPRGRASGSGSSCWSWRGPWGPGPGRLCGVAGASAGGSGRRDSGGPTKREEARRSKSSWAEPPSAVLGDGIRTMAFSVGPSPHEHYEPSRSSLVHLGRTEPARETSPPDQPRAAESLTP